MILLFDFLPEANIESKMNEFQRTLELDLIQYLPAFITDHQETFSKFNMHNENRLKEYLRDVKK